MEKKSNKGLIGLIVLLIILFFIVLALVGYIIWDKTNNQKTEISTTTTTIPIQTTTKNVDNNYNSEKKELYGKTIEVVYNENTTTIQDVLINNISVIDKIKNSLDVDELEYYEYKIDMFKEFFLISIENDPVHFTIDLLVFDIYTGNLTNHYFSANDLSLTSYTIKEEEIELHMTLSHCCDTYDINDKTLQDYTCDELKSLKDYVVAATYKVEYLNDGTLSYIEGYPGVPTKKLGDTDEYQYVLEGCTR